jgi:diphthamide synthase (EF-2-diphthine--ammonia ligase)
MGGKKETKEKPLEKMTAKELRELAADMSEITGAHGMNKAELVAEIKKVRGITDDGAKKATHDVREVKKAIKSLKVKRADALSAGDKKTATIYRRRISRLKRKTRQAA